MKRGRTNQLHITALSVLRSRLQQPPNGYGVEEQEALHYLECHNWIHLHFSLVQILLPVVPYTSMHNIRKQYKP